MSRPRLFRDTVLYAITGIATKMIGALLLPILTRLLSVQEYGTIDLITLGSLLVFELVVLGTDFTVTLYYHDATVDRRRLSSTLLLLRLSLGSGFTLILLASAPYLAHVGFSESSAQGITSIRIAALSLPASGILSFWIIWLRQAGRSGALLGITLIRVVATALTTIVLVTRAANPVVAYFWAIFGVDLALALIVTVACWNQVGRPDWVMIRPIVAKGIAFLPRATHTIVMALITRQILLHSDSLEAIGQYAAATKISYIAWIGISASSQAWLAYSLSVANQPEAPDIYRRYLANYVSWIGFGVVGLALFAADILRVLTTPTYVLAAPTVGWQALSLMAIGSLVIISTGLNITKDTGVIGRTTLLSGVLNIGLAVVLIPWIGIVGAAIAAAFDQGLAAFVLYQIAQRRYPLPFDGKIVLRWIALAVLGVGLATIMPTSFSWTFLTLKLSCIGCYAAALIMWGNPAALLPMLHRLKSRKEMRHPS